ncbi:unnamed protein product [Adineta steineri]|uniref:Uncharacterized protein n=1 Tax=Adineta steineri TaxID=433720 RepID=A0A815TMF7_9BILA|nr:unnamed protein product [Adineta steineri]CAF1647205.1 unnamed protein product [Adineta steineri]
MDPKPKKTNNQKGNTTDSMSESACGSTVSKFEAGDEHEKYWLDENDEENIDELGTKHAELMALPEDLRVGWEILAVTAETDVSSLSESANKSTQENNDPANNSSVDDKEQKSDNMSQGGSKRKHEILTPATAKTPAVLKKASHGNSAASVASSTSIDIVRNKNPPSSTGPKQKIVPLLSDTSNFVGSKDVEKKPDAPPKKDQIGSTIQSSGLASANDEQRALTERDGKPAFLTAAEVHDGKLGCKLDENNHAVYVLTIAVPEWIHLKMLLDQTLGNLKFVQLENVDIDEEKKIVNIKGKIGETTNLSSRETTYYNCQRRTDSISKVINFLRIKEGYDREKIEQMVKITPLMSHRDLCVSSLKNLTKRLHVYMAQKIEVDGMMMTRRKLAGQKAAATKRKKFQKPDGTWTTINLETGRKVSEALTRKIQKEDGSWTTRGAEIAQKGVATMSKEIPIVGGTTTILKQKARQAADTKATTMFTLNSGQQVNQHQYDASNQENEQI